MTSLKSRPTWYVCFEPSCVALSCFNQYFVCGACHPKNDFWNCPFVMYVIIQFISFPIRLFAGIGCGALGFVYDLMRWLYWFVTGCGFCNVHANQINGCGNTTPGACCQSYCGCAPGGDTNSTPPAQSPAVGPGCCRYYIGANVKSKFNGSQESGTGSRPIHGLAHCCRAVCCVIPQDRTQESVCFECCEGDGLPNSNAITYCWNPQHTNSEQEAAAAQSAQRDSQMHAIHATDIPMHRGDDFV